MNTKLIAGTAAAAALVATVGGLAVSTQAAVAAPIPAQAPSAVAGYQLQQGSGLYGVPITGTINGTTGSFATAQHLTFQVRSLTFSNSALTGQIRPTSPAQLPWENFTLIRGGHSKPGDTTYTGVIINPDGNAPMSFVLPNAH